MPKGFDPSNLTRREILMLPLTQRLQLAIGRWCREKHGQLGICTNPQHTKEVSLLEPILKEYGLLQTD